MDGGAILAVALIVGVVVLSVIGLDFLVTGADKLESDKLIVPDMEINIENGVTDTTFIYRKQW